LYSKQLGFTRLLGRAYPKRVDLPFFARLGNLSFL
jgi:hypothetical protein